MNESIAHGAKRVVAAAAALLAVALTTGAARSQSSEQWAGAVLGGIAGGLLGSEIGKGQGREIAIGAGALLGGLSGSYLAGRSDSAAARTRYAPAYAAPAHTHRHMHRHAPRPVERVTVYERVYVAPPEPRNITTRRGGRAAAGAHRDPFTSCRMLEDGLAPVYACRTAHGDWKVLR